MMLRAKKFLTLLVLVALLISACQPIVAQPLVQPAAQTTEEAANLEVARRYMQELWNEGKLEVYDELIATDFVDLAPRPGFGSDREAFRTDLEGFHQDFPNQMAQFTIDDMLAADDWVALRGDFVVSPPDSPQPATTEYAVMLRIVDGLIRERWGVFNELKLMTGMGFTLTPPTAAVPDVELPEGGAIVQTNDVATYYELHGVGEPLLFMPGDFRTTEDVADLTTLLAKEYQVIVMDPRGRGRSSDSEAPLTMALMADDAVALLDQLDVEKAHVVGWASSAVVALDMAMRYPDRVNKLVLQGPNYTVDGLAPDHLAWFAGLVMEEMVPRFEEQYNRTAPDPDYLLTMLNRFQELLLREPNYTVEMLSQIQAPTLVIDGDLDDWIVREHLETLAATIPNGQLVLLPELTHFAPFEDAAAWTDAVLTFLAEE